MADKKNKHIKGGGANHKEGHLGNGQDDIFLREKTNAVQDSLLTILDNLDAFVFVTDLMTYEVLYVNLYGKKIYGDVIGKKCWSAIQGQEEGPCSFCTNYKLLDDAGRPTGAGYLEYENSENDRWFACRDNALRWFDGRLVRLAVVTDITDKKKAEQDLKEREKEFRAVFDFASVGIVQVDPSNGQMIRYNEKYREITGYTDAELKRISFPELTHPEDRQRDWEKFSQAARGETPFYRMEKRYLRKDGSIIWVRLNASFIRDEKGRPIRTVAVCEDITERKKAEEALRKSEARIRTKLDSILSPRGDPGELELKDVIDVEAIQSIMDDFCNLTGIGIGIVDLKGNLLVAKGWQELCSRFHRAHPETASHCRESDTELTKNVTPGSFKLYRCKNNMWDIATPLMIGSRHLGNLFVGQFFFEDEKIDYKVFRCQAQKYGFNEKAYLEALDKVPRFSRATINTAMDFYSKFANMTSLLSYSNLELARTISERDVLIGKLKKAEQKMSDYNLELEALYQKLDEELDKGQKVHLRTIPTKLPQIEGLSLAAYYQPAQKLGGDFYDVIQKGNKVCLYLSDVSGSGLDGAMLSLFVKHTIKNYISFTPGEKLAPSLMLAHLAEQFRQEDYPEEYFIALFMAVLDLETKKLTFSGAGFHDSPLLLTGSGERLALTGEGIAVSANVPRELTAYLEKTITLDSGATIFFHTDGLTEEEKNGSMYLERLPAVFYGHAHLQPQEIIQAVLSDFRSFNNGFLQGQDDITMLVLQT